MVYVIDTYLKFLDSVIADCGSVSCLTPASNAVTRRAKASYVGERATLVKLAARQGVTELPWETYDRLWPKLCKHQKYGVLRDDYATPKETAHDLRWPQDGRLVPAYAKEVLAQVHTLVACVAAVSEETAKAA